MSLLEQQTALYTPEDIAYAQVMSGPYESLSGFSSEGIVIAGQKDGRITGFWRPVVCFGSDRFQSTMANLLWERSQDILYQDFLIDGCLSPISRFLLGKGYIAELHYTHVIELTRSMEQLHQDVRKSYHSLITKQDRVEFCGIDTFQGIHEYVKKKARPQASWDIQKKMETICCHDNGRCGVMFYVGPVWAYYASAAGDNIHAAVWACLMELKQRGVQFVEMGEQKFSGDDKQVNISRFKAGFSGETRVRLLLKKA